jgi:hypothetical protein
VERIVMKLQVAPNHFTELLGRGYSLDHIYLLKLIDEGYDLNEMKKSSLKIATLFQSLVRKGLVFEENKLTTDGKELIIFIDSKEGKRIKKVAKSTTEFDLWWSEYPGTTNFTYKGRTFQGDRSIRVGKDDCKTKFNKILLQGEYTATELIEALKYEVMQKKENSIRQGVNKLTYMQNSLTYLNQLTFIPYVELIKSGTKIEETNKSSSNGTDI